MAQPANLYVNDYGVSLFEMAHSVYDLWLECIPYVNSGAAGVEAYSQRQLVRDVWPAVEPLCIRLEAQGRLSASGFANWTVAASRPRSKSMINHQSDTRSAGRFE